MSATPLFPAPHHARRSSLRTKLLVWYALVLGGLALSGAALLVLNVRGVVIRDVDTRLQDLAAELRDAVAPDPESPGKFLVELTENLIEQFRREGDAAPYYRIWNSAGELVDTSHPGLEISVPPSPGERDREGAREVTLAGPSSTLVLVGKGTLVERTHLRELTTAAALASLAALALLLAVGWFLTDRALAPIARITRAAAAVSATNLSERIDVAAMESELAELAATINGAFERLGQALDQQSRFTAHASHELRTPLAIIRANTDLALSRERSGEDYRETLETVRRAASRMEAVVEGLLTLARANAGSLTLAREPVELRSLIEETCDLCRPLAEQRGISLMVDSTDVFVQGDRDRLGEAVINLVSNALLYNSEGGRVEVTLAVEGQEAVFRVRDTGPGVLEAERERIFEPFYRGRDNGAGQPTGSGLGLAITRWIAQVHGGSIGCENHPEGGAIFKLRLPVHVGNG